MPLKQGWSRTSIFTQAWIDSLSPVAELGYAGTIEIYFQETTGTTYDPETGEYTYSEPEVKIFSGPARIQPVRAARHVNNNASDTEVQVVRFQITAQGLDLKTKYKVRVTKCANNESLTKLDYVIQEVMDSSNAFERTFEAVVDTEVRAN